MTMTKAERDEYLARVKQAALQIDAETAEWFWHWADELDPYGIGENETGDTDEGASSINKCTFFRAPGSDVWVWLHDLPKTTIEALRKRDERERAAIIQAHPAEVEQIAMRFRVSRATAEMLFLAQHAERQSESEQRRR
jgi:hypothetical protein